VAGEELSGGIGRAGEFGEVGSTVFTENFLGATPLKSVAFYTRRLPHWQPDNCGFFVTWRLYGSLPKAAHGAAPLGQSAGEAFRGLDRQLDRATIGPLWLKNKQVAESVSRILLSGMSEWRLYELLAWVVMANHVHVLLRPSVPLSKALMNIKGASGRSANAILNRRGKTFWQEESYDHWVRSDRERASIIRYIHHNPVSAGLVNEPQEWPWSSAGWVG
jgi:putative transposase